MSNLKRKDIFLSIIIPTKSEEKYIEPLLHSIKEQKNYHFDYEIIVADANSEDKTIEIAKKYWCKVINWWTPAVWKNNWVKVAKWKYLLFLDADCKLNPNSFNKWFNNINYNIWKPYLSSLENNSIYDKIINLIFFKSRYITYNMYNAIDFFFLL